jgi:hypothetical protein
MQKELKKIKSLIGEDFYNVLKGVKAYVAGGALTSVFTNKEVNDIDVYFPNEEAFVNTLREIYKEEEDLIPDNIVDFLGSFQVKVNHVSSRAVLCTVDGGQHVQLIAHRFYEKPEDIFETFDFTINMAVFDLASETLLTHPDFLKHCSQRYLAVNPKTSYPLISVLRVNKYKDRGYTISKSQLLRLLLAVNELKIDTWDKLFDQLGGMYGTAPEDIFDKTQEFSTELAIETLDRVEFKERLFANNPTFDDIMLAIPTAFPLEKLQQRRNELQDLVDKPLPKWYGDGFYEVEKKTLVKLESYLKGK